MAARSQTVDQVQAALRAVEDTEATNAEKAEMLMEVAMGLQQKPKTAGDLHAAIRLYETALSISAAVNPLLAARIRARMGTALLAIPSARTDSLEKAAEAIETALATLNAEGTDEEIAEAEMNLGLTLQNLAGANKARIQDCISAYQRALRTFDKERHPQEFAILQNNLATAFLSIPFTDERSKMREALAVQAFEEGLTVVNLIDHPREYAMLQNNLGNALQYVSSSHRVENGFRALEAYDEALKVRTAQEAPGEYANTLANRANCLANLPDQPDRPEDGNPENLTAAASLYREAEAIFRQRGETDKAAAVAAAIGEIETEQTAPSRRANGLH